MKQTNIEIDETLVAEGLRMTGLGSMESLVDYAIRELLGSGTGQMPLPVCRGPAVPIPVDPP